MTESPFARSASLLGAGAIQMLGACRVLLFGVGGVGSWCAEALIRSGIGQLQLVDPDRISPSNLNRQLPALHSTLGCLKVEVLARRLRDINPLALIEAEAVFFDQATVGRFDFACYDYVVDAIDTVSSKLLIVERARMAGVPVVSAMGTGNKRRPELLRRGLLSETHSCPLARVMRRELRRRGITDLPVVWSPEEPMIPTEADGTRSESPGSLPWVPPVAGFLLAAHVIEALLAARAGDSCEGGVSE
ncbi:MAG: tRNA threonylcarbamoyladenosine dehydratase [Bacillota bacterium]|nr:tRNA threonylcarbamoyladenosine dehydratase [Bacillota bacterium]